MNATKLPRTLQENKTMNKAYVGAIEQVLARAAQLVREAGYNAVRMEQGDKDEAYSRAIYLYDLAVSGYRDIAVMIAKENEAEAFIRATYRPTCR
jgi:hypothetical protein